MNGYQFLNPVDDRTEKIGAPFLWCLLFGCFYFAYKGAWMLAVMAFILTWSTCGLAWLIFPFFARELIEANYLRRGWLRAR